MLNTELKLSNIEVNSLKELQISKKELNELQNKLDVLLNQIERDIDNNIKLSKEKFGELRNLVKKITLSQEGYGKNMERTSL